MYSAQGKLSYVFPGVVIVTKLELSTEVFGTAFTDGRRTQELVLLRHRHHFVACENNAIVGPLTTPKVSLPTISFGCKCC